MFRVKMNNIIKQCETVLFSVSVKFLLTTLKFS